MFSVSVCLFVGVSGATELCGVQGATPISDRQYVSTGEAGLLSLCLSQADQEMVPEDDGVSGKHSTCRQTGLRVFPHSPIVT